MNRRWSIATGVALLVLPLLYLLMFQAVKTVISKRIYAKMITAACNSFGV